MECPYESCASQITEVLTVNFKPYRKDYEYSYTLGMFPTIEMLHSVPEKIVQVVFSSQYRSPDSLDIQEMCNDYHIPWTVNDRLIAKLSPKENCYLLGIFRKFEKPVHPDENHIVLCRPGNLGNLGTILRTALGFNYRDIVIIRPAADLFDPKTIRSSMGALFKLNFSFFQSLDEYTRQFDHDVYAFRLNGEEPLEHAIHMGNKPHYSLLFGNESTGLLADESMYGTGVVIPHSPFIDSLNLPTAVGIALYEFSKGDFDEEDGVRVE